MFRQNVTQAVEQGVNQCAARLKEEELLNKIKYTHLIIKPNTDYGVLKL